MIILRGYSWSLVLLTAMICIPIARPQAINAAPTLIDFEGLGLSEGTSVPEMAGVMFEAAVAVQGAPEYAFGVGGSIYDTGNAPPFSNSENIFITNQGGFASPEADKHINIDFPYPVSNLSFLVADIDSLAGEVTEQLTATVFDADGLQLDMQVHTAPDPTPRGGDGEVVLISFGTLGGIRRLELVNDPIYNQLGTNRIGWGVDNLSFTPIPAPTPIVLGTLGAGLVGWLRRRKAL